MSTWDVIYGLLALGTYHQVSRWSDFVGTTPRSYVRRFHGGYVAVTRPENFPGALRAPDSLPTFRHFRPMVSSNPCRPIHPEARGRQSFGQPGTDSNA